MSTRRVRQGVDPDLEAAADALIKRSFEEEPDPEGKGMILTRWMQIARYRREVYTADGAPDAAVRRGIYTRVLNPTHPHLNAVEGISRPRKQRASDHWEGE